MLKKGFFPHEFNKEEKQDYIGSWPEQHYFGVKFMTSEILSINSINGLLVDGFDEKSNTEYQFSGCYWHACPKSFSANTYNRVKLKSMGAIYKKHLKIMNRLKSIENLKGVEIWECEFDLMCKKDEDLKQF